MWLRLNRNGVFEVEPDDMSILKMDPLCTSTDRVIVNEIAYKVVSQLNYLYLEFSLGATNFY